MPTKRLTRSKKAQKNVKRSMKNTRSHNRKNKMSINNKNKNKNSDKNRNRNNHNKFSRSKRANNTIPFNRTSKYNNSNYVLPIMRGGSDWISSQYSLGSANAPEQSSNYLSQFSHSPAGSRDMYMNPPNLGSAGSGGTMSNLEGAGVSKVGAPY